MRTRSALVLVILALSLAALAVSCSESVNPLIGQWQGEDGSYGMLEFKGDGTWAHSQLKDGVWTKDEGVSGGGLYRWADKSLRLLEPDGKTVIYDIKPSFDGEKVSFDSAFSGVFVRMPKK